MKTKIGYLRAPDFDVCQNSFPICINLNLNDYTKGLAVTAGVEIAMLTLQSLSDEEELNPDGTLAAITALTVAVLSHSVINLPSALRHLRHDLEA